MSSVDSNRLVSAKSVKLGRTRRAARPYVSIQHRALQLFREGKNTLEIAEALHGSIAAKFTEAHVYNTLIKAKGDQSAPLFGARYRRFMTNE